MGGAGRQTAFTFHYEDLDLARARELERECLAGRYRHAVAGGTGVRFEEESPPRELGVAG